MVSFPFLLLLLPFLAFSKHYLLTWLHIALGHPFLFGVFDQITYHYQMCKF